MPEYSVFAAGTSGTFYCPLSKHKNGFDSVSINRTLVVVVQSLYGQDENAIKE